ncbi:hypothetical protein SEA_EVILGENIUS_8 [Mycobacterium phage EvilGenius]|uniref:Uncharacterized protein n=1 Tax=Mycobacterium phage EvilGenius TaxID=1821723 RepID=A0A143FQJ4_9CAUD|nr:hypothetical protein SEA_EVILGENIUS_8 [Mycobacterium phage EvilGenius]AMW64086.1 hypothetical protein SEA_EVILGENIUS_8 [Mycobacterium phage EvilGenius]AMW64265.1 hypothetical protein SEA_CHIPMUNK_8 [Mycobacterium phage ChipMunk]QKY78799.1 hypothetical protein KINGCYRUS_8 [Mycobacterium phage KingCyrus]
MAQIQIPKPDGSNGYYTIFTENFPDASTAEGQEAILATLDALNPNPYYMLVGAYEDISVPVAGGEYPAQGLTMFPSLQDWFDTL